jgi:DNA-binding NarL/FixJ family response regulator
MAPGLRRQRPPKTASVHVSNILAKLSAGRRTEAAAIAHRYGLGMMQEAA